MGPQEKRIGGNQLNLTQQGKTGGDIALGRQRGGFMAEQTCAVEGAMLCLRYGGRAASLGRAETGRHNSALTGGSCADRAG